MKVDLTNPIFHDEAKATAHMEADRWADGVVCPYCGSVNVHRMGGKTQNGMFLCNDCRDKFTVRTGSVFERSHIPLHKWLLATHLMAASKKGMSALQLQRMLALGSYRSAWFMCHRIREAMKPENVGPLGGEGKTVEADETFIGGKRRHDEAARKRGRGTKKAAVLALVERDGKSYSFHVANVTAKTLRPIIVQAASRESHFMTDELASYVSIGREFADHTTVRHSIGEYVRLRSCQHGGVPFQPNEARGVRHASRDQRSSFVPLSDGMGFQIQHPQNDRRRTCGAGAQGRQREAPHVPAISSDQLGFDIRR